MAKSPADIRAARAADPASRARDFAEKHGISEMELVLAMGAVRCTPHPDALFPLLETLGPVLALTRNASCVIEQVGPCTGFRPGARASMVNGPVLDMRMFPAHWQHCLAVTGDGKSSLQIFDAAGQAVHKLHLRPESDSAAFEQLVSALRLPDQDQPFTLATPAAPEPARSNPAAAAALAAGWDEMTDTHQFLKLAGRHGMNRLGAYRVAGPARAEALMPEAVTEVLRGASGGRVPLMIFVGNAGCIQIHGGPVDQVKATGSWINVLDPAFNLHLRQDHVAEVWLVNKPTRRGPAISVEAFDAAGSLIVQIFDDRRQEAGPPWADLLAGLSRREVAA